MNNKLLDSIIVSENATLRDAMLSYQQSAFRVSLICDENRKLHGLATEGDVRRALLSGHGLLSPLLPFANRNPITGNTSMSRENMVNMLTERIHFLPVLNDKGIVEDILSFDKRTIIPVASPTIGERELRYVTDAVLSGWISSQGEYITRFEKGFSDFCNTKHCVIVSNGTVALHLALTALEIGPGDEVIVPALTFVATASAVRHCGAKPVFVDIDRSSWTIDPEKIEAAITPHTKAIIPVHLYGIPCRMDVIMSIANHHGLFVIEDAAEAHGAEFNGNRVGSIGLMGIFSFYGNKIITTGEGGAIVTNDSSLNKKLRMLRDHGMSQERRYWHEVIGYNYRLTNIQAAIGVAQLERWGEIFEAKKKIKELYEKHISNSKIITPKGPDKANPVCWLYTIMLGDGFSQVDRDHLLIEMKERKIDSRPVFYTIPSMPPYYEQDWKERYSVSYYVSSHGFSLPSSVELNEKDISKIAITLSGLI